MSQQQQQQGRRGWMQMVEPGHDAPHQETVHADVSIRYGTSLKLQAAATACILSSECFDLDVNRDWKKHTRRGHDLLFFAMAFDGAELAESTLLCAARAIIDNTGPRCRAIIDHVFTPEAYRGRGLATLLVEFIQNWSVVLDTDVLVLSLEESAPYWMERGFVLEEDEAVYEQYNSYSDTILLKIKMPDVGQCNVLRQQQT